MSILTLDEAQKLIAGSPIGTSRYDDADIQSDIDTAEQQIANVVGPLAPTVVTVHVYSRAGGVALPTGPYVGPITALVLNGEVQSAWSPVTVDGAGFVRGLPCGSCTLTYTAGWSALPADVLKAIAEQFKHVWSFRRGNTRAPESDRGSPRALSPRAAELVAPHRWSGPRP